MRSALFVELESAARAAHHDVTLSAGNADLLAALRAFVNVVVLKLGEITRHVREVSQKPVPELKELLILRLLFGHIPREHPEVQDQKKKEGNQP